MSTDFTKVRSRILSSSVPLESEIEGIVTESGFVHVEAEPLYQRFSAAGIRDFSIDLLAGGIIYEGDFEGNKEINGVRDRWDTDVAWRFGVECKYTKPGVDWLFLRKRKPYFTSDLDLYRCLVEHRGHLWVRTTERRRWLEEAVSFIPPQETCPGYLANKGDWSAIPVTRGLEVRPQDSGAVDVYDKPIREGVSQLQFATAPLLWPTVARALRGSAPEFHWLRAIDVTVFSVFLVTTASLWVLKPELSIADVEQSSSIGDVAEPVEAVEFLTTLSDELRAHQRRVVDGYRDWTRIDVLNPSDRSELNRWADYATPLERAAPSVFIVSRNSFANTLKRQREALSAKSSSMIWRLAGQLDMGPR